MTKELNGAELVDFIKERQARQVRNLRQADRIIPKLLIIMGEHASGPSETYVRMKGRYGNDVLIEVEVATCAQNDMPERIAQANTDTSIHGIIVQLPLDDTRETEMICNMIAPAKDVDGLGQYATFPSATAEAIDWLLAGYNVELEGKRITIVGNGKLVGAPLYKMWRSRDLFVNVVDEYTEDVDALLRASGIIVTAAGVPRLITTGNVPEGAVVIDAGTASENGVLVGDVDDAVRERGDITITPVRGGVGPLTVCVLFDHVIQAALKVAGKL